ncbi:sigma-70 family RNA polymerase sigma factor [Azospirillum sp. ST 5-10]|uniref:sigma-70 family RNA polymerase sigma factor n=1 Tax=unclassified Azospirillum TaxID=2630922 RepID=UPI003F49C210
MDGRDPVAAFAEARPTLLGLAYRILGSRADAEDAVQDTFLKWQAADRAAIDNPAGWLTTACTRRCLDLLRAAHRARVDYVGAWLPEPVHTAVPTAVDDAEDRRELAASLTTAFLLMLERLAPKERAAFLLHEVFDRPYPEVAAALGVGEAACRKLVQRAKANVDRTKVRHVVAPDRQDRLLDAFRTAVTDGITAPLAALLSDDVRLSADGGGKVATLLDVLQGKTAVLSFLTDRLGGYWADYRWVPADINGGRGFLLRSAKHQGVGGVAASVGFAFDEAGRATDVFIVRNPDKLAALAGEPIR